MLTLESTALELRALVRDHAIAYDLELDERAVARRDPSSIGYRVRLVGNARGPHLAAAPGCEACRDTYAALVRIANAVLPDAGRPTRCERGPFEASWDVSVARPHAIELSVVLIGRQGAGEPIETCQRECLREIERGLKTLGVARLSVSVH